MRRIIGIVSLALLLVVSACSNSTPDDSDAAEDITPKDGPTITVGSADFTESIILAELYAQGLEAKGYTTATKLRIGSREVYFPALEKGDIDLMPEYTGSLLSYLTKQEKTVSPDSDTTYEDLTAELEGKAVDVLEFATAQDQDGIVTNEKTAEAHGLESLSDLTALNGKLIMGGPAECPKRQACLKGLKSVYKYEPKEFKALDTGGPATVQLLKSDEIQLANLFTTDSRIAANGFVLLEDDKGIVGAENVVPVIRSETLEAYDEELTEAINAITAALTTENLTALNSRVDTDKEDPEDVAADFLDAESLA